MRAAEDIFAIKDHVDCRVIAFGPGKRVVVSRELAVAPGGEAEVGAVGKLAAAVAAVDQEKLNVLTVITHIVSNQIRVGIG